ncbi:hypothetical protein [Bradyrhizobium sp. AZCC 2289]|uniref:hypothetical protein n=1 Tax=Bradyrhizobium sp. AZCC 2289 TaxID=3117026 RepID=UPI002FF04A56
MLGGKRRFSRSGDTISKWNAILPAHPMGELAVRCGARFDDMATPGKLGAFRDRHIDVLDRQEIMAASARARNDRHPSPGRSFRQHPQSLQFCPDWR